MKQLLTAFLLFQFSFLSYAMEGPIYNMPRDFFTLIFSYLPSWQDRHSVSITAKWLRYPAKDHNKNSLGLMKIVSFTKAKTYLLFFVVLEKHFVYFRKVI